MNRPTASATRSDVLALDGPAGAGKSTVARCAAERLGLTVLDTGAMYRAVTIACLHAGVELQDGEACARIGLACTITLGNDGTVLLDGRDVTQEVRTPEITATVSTVSAHPQVREIMVGHQRAWAAHHGAGVVEGRDIGTVVFPDARLKVFLVASNEVRARRRLADESAAGRTVALADVLADLERRDTIDSERASSPLKPAADAVLIDTTDRDIDDVVTEIVARFATEGFETPQ